MARILMDARGFAEALEQLARKLEAAGSLGSARVTRSLSGPSKRYSRGPFWIRRTSVAGSMRARSSKQHRAALGTQIQATHAERARGELQARDAQQALRGRRQRTEAIMASRR